MEEYRFTRDKAFLEKYYNVMRDAAIFFTEFLSTYKQWMVTNPTLSPENVFFQPGTSVQTAITLGSTMDNSLLWELFGSVLEAQAILGKRDNVLKSSLTSLRAKLPPYRVSKRYGGIMEWVEDYEEAEPGHRHISHLFGVYPGAEITSYNSTLFKAAKDTIVRRLQ